jgi:alkylhydroperoxidase/carboxymuconolactone decarboxylase family protein YurZ
MNQLPTPPETYQEFVRRFPKLGQAWESLHAAGDSGPLDEKTRRLVKLSIAIGALREGAVHANVRKALATGITRQEIDHVLALAAGTLGLPATVATYSWIEDAAEGKS